jgi:hypothetical protein
LELAALFSLSGEGAAEFSIRIDAKAIPTAIEYLIECMISLLRGAAKSHWDRDLRIATVQQEFRSPAILFSRSDPQNSPAFHLDPGFQHILHSEGYKVGSGDLAKEIDLLLNEIDPNKAIPLRLRTTIDLIRNFGNFSAHPIDDKTTLQIIDIEPHEAESCLDILEECFEHFYVGPAAAKARKLALDAKLAAAKKPPSK